MTFFGRAVLLVCAAATASMLVAAEPAKIPAALQKLLACRSIAAADARLACYDAQVDALVAAVERKDIVAVDRAQVRTARKSLFGLTLPNFSIFGGDKDADDKETEGFSEIESTIRQVRQISPNRWLVVLEDGARWVQNEPKSFVHDPKPGMSIRIRRAALGSFMASIDKQTAVRFHREN